MIGIVTIVVLLIFLITFIALASGRSKDNAARWDNTKLLSVQPNPFIDERFDQTAQSYTIGLALHDSVNGERKLFKKSYVEWQDDWFNLANQMARELAQGTDTDASQQMNSLMESMDQEKFHVTVDS